MSLVPVDRQTGLRRHTNEQERARLKKEHEKAEWNRRNPDSKWKV